MKTNNPYQSAPPKMILSFVCYADILGYKSMSNAALKAGIDNGDLFLQRLHAALTNAYKRMRDRSTGSENRLNFIVKIFTDNIVIGYPLKDPGYDFGEPELGDIMWTFNELQLALALEGFFLRGGIALGYLYMDEDIVFGDGLLHAVEQDKSGGPPRLSLTPSTIEAVRRQLGFYGPGSWTPQYESLLKDADGTIFINYLSDVFCAFPDSGIDFESIRKHGSIISSNLQKFRGDPDVRAKYEWLARYHNFVCKDFVARHPIPTYDDYDPIYAEAATEALELLNCIIDIESIAAAPTHIDLEPIKLQRLSYPDTT